MNSSELIQPHHLERRAVIYIRQSTRHQVLSNLESQRLQRNMRQLAVDLGWPAERIEVVDADTGLTGANIENRQEYKNLLGEVALGHVGIVISYESARVSRNLSDWYPLLDLCTAKRCLIADRDGVYDPATANGRLLLGMKGMVSELELHTLRGRLIAGIQNKARRGELALALPAGLVRLEDGSVVKDPNIQVQKAIELVFATFLELRSASKVVRRFREGGIGLPRSHRNQEIVWRQPTLASIVRILRNPVYAGAFVYGRTGVVRQVKPSGVQVYSRPRAREEWTVVVKERYPPYIAWETFERIQSILHDNQLEYDRNKTRGVPRDGTALLHGMMYCGACGHKMVVQYKGGTRYLCNHFRIQQQAPVCQYIPGDPIDAFVVKAFFEALSPAEIDVYATALEQRRQSQRSLDSAQEREIQRLRYQADLARRQFDRVDPDNRLVASELERRWETALAELRRAEELFETQKSNRDKIIPLTVSRELRDAFQSIGQSLPSLWSQPKALSQAQRKALLRCLIDKIVIHRGNPKDHIHTRIVWRGGAFSEAAVPVTIHSEKDLTGYTDMVRKILELESQGMSDQIIATTLTAEGFRSALAPVLLRSTVQRIRLEHGRIHRFRAPRPRRVEGFLTLPQLADTLGVKRFWIYHLIDIGRIEVDRDPRTRLYLFPDTPKTIRDFTRLKQGAIQRVSCGRRHHRE